MAYEAAADAGLARDLSERDLGVGAGREDAAGDVEDVLAPLVGVETSPGGHRLIDRLPIRLVASRP
jgi:hypothetical protein